MLFLDMQGCEAFGRRLVSMYIDDSQLFLDKIKNYILFNLCFDTINMFSMVGIDVWSALYATEKAQCTG